MDKPEWPNPGSDEAGKAGCRCPILDNEHGRGYMGQPGLFVMSFDCPLHGIEAQQQSGLDTAQQLALEG